MDLAQRDRLFIEIKNKIQCKQNALLDRFDAIKKASTENKLLEGVLQDYVKYYQDAINTKTQQEEALLILRDYLETISSTVDKSSEKMDYLHNEKMNIIKKLQDVRSQLKTLNEKTKINMGLPLTHNINDDIKQTVM